MASSWAEATGTRGGLFREGDDLGRADAQNSARIPERFDQVCPFDAVPMAPTSSHLTGSGSRTNFETLGSPRLAARAACEVGAVYVPCRRRHQSISVKHQQMPPCYWCNEQRRSACEAPAGAAFLATDATNSDGARAGARVHVTRSCADRCGSFSLAHRRVLEWELSTVTARVPG